MIIDLKGKRALVTGASKGIGAAIAKALADCEATLVIVSRNEQQLDALRHSFAEPLRHRAFSADLSTQEGVSKVVNAIEDQPVDIVINNAGGPAPGPISNAEIVHFEQALQTHLFASHQISQAALKQMKEEGFGRIINVISTSVKMPIPGLGVSNTIRGAMASWSKTLSGEVASYGVTVNNILPGAVETGRLRSIIESKAEKNKKTVAEMEADMMNEIPAGRFGRPVELGHLAAFLASDLAGYITGVSIPVDGGRTGAL